MDAERSLAPTSIKKEGVSASTTISTALSSVTTTTTVASTVPKMTLAQFYERKEAVRDNILAEAKRLKITILDMIRVFPISTSSGNQNNENRSEDNDNGPISLTRTAFKRKLLDLGFQLTSMPDEDIALLDGDGSGSISTKEFLEFF